MFRGTMKEAVLEGRLGVRRKVMAKLGLEWVRLVGVVVKCLKGRRFGPYSQISF